MNTPYTPEETQAWLAKLPKKGVGVKGIIKTSTGKILLLKPPRKGWQFPGGSVDKNEDPKDALIRELKEEIKLNVATSNLKLAGVAYRADFDHIVIIYAVDITVAPNVQFNLQAEEISEYRFFDTSQAKELINPAYRDSL